MSVLNWLEQTLDRRKEWIGCITPAYEAWNVLQAIKNIAIWPFSPPQINIMKGGHMFDYNQFHESAFLERKCNFRLELMYFKSFLSPLVLLGGVVVVPPMWFSSWGWSWDEDWHWYAAAMVFCYSWKSLAWLKGFFDYPLIGVKGTAISCHHGGRKRAEEKGREWLTAFVGNWKCSDFARQRWWVCFSGRSLGMVNATWHDWGGQQWWMWMELVGIGDGEIWGSIYTFCFSVCNKGVKKIHRACQ